ncbi:MULTISPECIES: hypothetical protein [Prochlorococcus]|nr:hypothetical protein [Prochlorococcus marinus]
MQLVIEGGGVAVEVARVYKIPYKIFEDVPILSLKLVPPSTNNLGYN